LNPSSVKGQFRSFECNDIQPAVTVEGACSSIEPAGHDLLVAGKNRLFAMENILDWAEVDLCAIEHVKLKHAEAMPVVENIWR
jgi:hypothetical protein